MRLWLRKHWNLWSRQVRRWIEDFAKWRQRQYEKAVEWYAIERAIFYGRRAADRQPRAKIAKPSRQIARAQGRKMDKILKQLPTAFSRRQIKTINSRKEKNE